MATLAARLGAAVPAGLATLALLLSLPGASPQIRQHPVARAAGFPGRSLAFEPNAGRVPHGADFYARLPYGSVALSRAGSRLTLGRGATLESRLVGARPGDRGRASSRLTQRVNWYVGSDPHRWKSRLATYGRVSYRGVYPGVDLVYHGRAGALEYDFVVRPGADPSPIALALRGARSLRLDPRGDLVASVAGRQVRQARPVAYQETAAGRVRVPASFTLDGNRVGVRLGGYDRSRPLVVDPVLVFADYIGSTGTDFAYDVAVDSAGNVYVGGETTSAAIPAGTQNGSGPGGYLLKINSAGTREWITYLTGRVVGVDVDSSGNPYITGATGDGLAVKDADQNGFGGGGLDAFVGRMNTDGTRNWLTYLGGSAAENTPQQMGAIAVDGSGNAYVTGASSSTGLARGTVWDSTGDASGDAFVAIYSATGTRLKTTYFGGSGSDSGMGIDVAPSCNSDCEVFVGGTTYSGDLPVLNAADNTYGSNGSDGNGDGFVVKFNATLSARGWATYYGDTAIDNGLGLVVDSDGNPTLAGYNDPDGVYSQAWVRTYYGPTGTYVFEKKFGGNGDDKANDVNADAQGNLFVIGDTASTDFQVISPIQQFPSGAGDVFILKIDRNSLYGSGNYVWSTYYGGGGFDVGNAVAPGPGGDLYAVGDTFSNDLPRIGSVQGSSNPYDGWIAKIAMKPVTIDSGPDGKLRSRDAAFTYSLAEPSATFQCRLSPVESDFSSCPNTGKSYSGLADGPYTFEVVGFDSSGAPGHTTTRQFEVDMRPIAQLSIAPNPALVGRAITFDGSASSGASQALVKFEWDLDGDGNFERDTGSTPTTTQTYPSPRVAPVTLRVTDASGATATAGAELRVNALTGPSQFGVTINKGAQYTRSPDVTVTANFPPATTSMLFSNDGGFLAPSTFPAQTSTKWKLDSSGPERLPKTIYVRFLANLIVSETYQDDIILDETPPVVQSATVDAAASAAAPSVAARSAKLRKWRLRVKAHDSNSGVAGIQATSNKRKPGKLLKYKRKLTVKSAKRPKFVRARDKAGNYSRWRKLR
jgi:hypothetical protein